MLNIKIYIYAAVGIALGLLILLMPEHYREQGRQEQRAEFKRASDMATVKSWRDLVATEQQLKKERDNHANEIAKNEEKFNKYVADVRAGRIAGLRITRTDLCTSSAEKTASTSGTVEEASVRLPRAIEEGLFRFAHDRDQIIIDFEAFKQDVRIAKCFAD